MGVDHHLVVISLLLVIGSGFMNAVWNFGAKKSRNKSVFLGCIILVSSIALMPHLIAELLHADLPAKAYGLMMASLLLQCGYSYLLSQMYRLGDLSQVHPILRGTGVILIPLIGVLFLGESLSVWGWMGIAVIACGILLLSGLKFRASSGEFTFKPVLYALLVGLCITSYTIVDKMTLDYLTPLSLLQVTNIGFLLVHVPALFNWKHIREEWMLNWNLILLGSVFSPGSYFLFLLAMNIAPVSYVAPIREISIVFTALLGIFFLKEKHGKKRLAASFIIVCGIVVVGMSK